MLTIFQEIQLKYQALDAFRETVQVFNDQLDLHHNHAKQAAQHEKHKFVLELSFLF